MKKLILSLMFLMACAWGAMAQNDAMYIYRNDGVVNAFLKSSVDSIRYSELDLDSLAHSEYVVQEVWTSDSVYRIPLAAVDSIGFVTPETVYQPGAVNITAEMRDYVVSSDSLLLVFAINTPQWLMPKVGDRLVNTEASGGLMSGFLGEVMEIRNTADGYAVYCDAINITDVFECYYGMAREEQPSEERSDKKGLADGYYSGNLVWQPGKLTTNLFTSFGELSYEKDGNLLVPSVSDVSFAVGLTPTVRTSAYLIVNKHYGVNMGITITGNYLLEESLSFSGSITGGGDIPLIKVPPIRIPQALCDIVIEPGVFLKSSLQISTKQHWTQRYTSAFHWEYSSKGMQSLKNVNSIRNVGNTHSGVIALKGSMSAGLYVKVGLVFIATKELDIAEVGLRLEGGLRFEGTALPYVSDNGDGLRSTALYNALKGQGVELCKYYGTSAYAKLFNWAWSHDIPDFGNIKFGKKEVLKSYYYVPDFKNTKLEQDEDGNYFASVDVVGRCPKTDIGFSLQSKSNPDDRVNGYCLYDYSGSSASAYSTFYNKPSQTPLIVYPLVKFGDIEMIAEPAAECGLHTCPDNNHPHAIDLGLPSGTKWCRSNVGATSPEQYGGYYAWGETSEKSEYSFDTYAYYDINSNKYINIGIEISGTQYDVAHVRMGGAWRMPTLAQLQELMSNCTYQWTQLNGVNGQLVTGPNGGQVFCPAAGYRCYDDLDDDGSFGYYWSGSLASGFDSGAYSLSFLSGLLNWYYDDRGDGRSVRAVCP